MPCRRPAETVTGVEADRTHQAVAPLRRRATASITSWELIGFRLAVATIALFVLDDAFVHRASGTTAADHAASALVPLLALAAAGIAYPHLRPGARATVALLIAPLAIAAGIADGVRHVALTGLDGDDLSAIGAGLGGAWLAGLGVVVLWHSRRTDGPLRSRLARRALRAAAAVLVGLLIALPATLAVVATHVADAPVVAAELGAPYRPVTLRTDDGLRLAAWYVPSRNGAAVIAFPGRSGPVPHARLLVRHGYGVLMLDPRGRGASEGDPNAYGWTGEPDLRAGLDFLAGRGDVQAGRIGGLGLSVGGELLLATAAHDTRLRAVVSEGAGVRSLAEHLHTPGLGPLQRWVTPWIAQTAALAVLSNATPPPDLTELAARVPPRPLLLIQAADGAGGEELNAVYGRAAGASATRWVARGGHTRALATQPREYERRVIGFLDEALRGDLRTASADSAR